MRPSAHVSPLSFSLDVSREVVGDLPGRPGPLNSHGDPDQGRLGGRRMGNREAPLALPAAGGLNSAGMGAGQLAGDNYWMWAQQDKYEDFPFGLCFLLRIKV